MDPADIRRRTRAHLIAFAAILALALMAAATGFGDRPNPSAVLAIAAVQVAIVLGAMMHAHRDGRWVRWLLAFCAVFVLALAGLTYLGAHDTIDGTERVIVSSPESAEGAETH